MSTSLGGLPIEKTATGNTMQSCICCRWINAFNDIKIHCILSLSLLLEDYQSCLIDSIVGPAN